jgi:hypothetical protein
MKPHGFIRVVRMWCGIRTDSVLRSFDNLKGLSCGDLLVSFCGPLEPFKDLPSPVNMVSPASSHADQKVISKVSPSPYHGSALSLNKIINLEAISSLDLNLDLMLPPYLSLSIVVDIIKLIMDDNCSFHGVSKNLLLECLENLEEEEAPVEQEVMVVRHQTVTPKKRRTPKVVELADVKSLRHNTRLNKNYEGFKASGMADVEGNNALAYVGRYDCENVVASPSHLSEENLHAIGSGFLKMHPMATSDAALFASSDEDIE